MCNIFVDVNMVCNNISYYIGTFISLGLMNENICVNFSWSVSLLFIILPKTKIMPTYHFNQRIQ